MPINNSFLSDLSSGIFERLGSLQNEQKAKDEQRRGEVLTLLANLADKVEPESQPLLLQHMGDVMKLQGPVKKFWQAFAGMPDRGFEDKLGTNLRETLGSLIGPDAARSRRGNAVADLATGSFTSPQTFDQATGLQGRMVLRDPRAERLEEIKNRYGVQNELNLHKLAITQDFQRTQQDDRQRHDKEMIDERKNAKAQGDVLNRAWTKSIQRGFLSPTPAIMSEAANEIAKEQGLSAELLNARLGLTQAKTRESSAIAGSLESTGGLKPSDVMAQKRFDQTQFDKARTLHSEWSDARAKARAFIPNLKSMEASLNRSVAMTGGKFDPGIRDFVMADPSLAPPSSAQKMKAEYLKALADEEESKAKMRSRYEQLKQLPDYAEVGPDEWGDINIKEGIAPAGAQRAGQAVRPQVPSKPGLKVGIGTSKGRTIIPVIDPMKYEVGGRIKYKGVWHKIIGLQGDAVIAIPE